MTELKLLVVVITVCIFNISYADIVIKGSGAPRPDNLDAAIELEPNNADLHNMRGNDYLKSKEYDKAIPYFTRAIQINPKYQEPYNGLGIAYRYLKNFDKAISNYTKAINLDSSYLEAYNNRGLTYLLLKSYENMCSDFIKACSLGDCRNITVGRQKGLCK